MDHYTILAAADILETAKSTARTFGLDLPHFIAQVISFLIVAGCLYKFAYKPVLTILAERRQKIADSLANAEKIKQKLQEAEMERQRLLNEANAQGSRLIEEARAAAARVKEVETQKAINEAAEIITKAKEAAQAEYFRQMTELRREIGRLVVQTTSKVTGKVLTSDDQLRLIEETNRQLAA